MGLPSCLPLPLPPCCELLRARGHAALDQGSTLTFLLSLLRHLLFEEQDQVSAVCCGLQMVEAGLRTVGWKIWGLAPIQLQQRGCFNPMSQICPKSQ